MDKFIGFLEQRLTYFLDVQMGRSTSERWLAACKLFQPTLPDKFRHFGQDIHHFPPRLKPQEFCVIMSNHSSDLDAPILMSLMHTDFLKRSVKNTPQDSKIQNYQTMKPIGFTHEHFSNIYYFGLVVKANCICLAKGMSDEELDKRIQKRIDEGYNVFIIEPEGGVMSKSNHEQSQEYWTETLEKKEPYPFKNCFLPKTRCWNRLIKKLGNRLRYLCDFTFLYENHFGHTVDWNYDIRPSIVDSFTNQPIGTLYTYLKMHDFVAKPELLPSLSNPETLIRLWRKKEKRMEFLRQRELEFTSVKT